MTDPQQFAAELLRTSAVGYAAAAARQYLSEHPSAAERYGPNAIGTWRELLTHRLFELATAVRLNRPALFAARIAWLHSAFAARHGDIGDLAAGLHALQTTLEAELPEQARGPVAACFAAGLAALDAPPGPSASLLDPSDARDRWALRYIAACLEGRHDEALAVVTGEARRELGAAGAYLDVLLPAQAEVGRLWHAGEITVAEEHLVSETTLQATVLLSAEPASKQVDKTVLTAAVEGNAHDIGIRAVADFFRMAGWRSIALGANVPAAEIARAAQTFGTDIVALSTTLTTQLEPLQETIALLRQAVPGVKIIVGGHVFDSSPDLWRDIGADAYTKRPDEAVQRAAGLLGVDAQPA